VKDFLNVMIVDDEEFQIDLLKLQFNIHFKHVRVVATAFDIHDAYEKILIFKPKLVFVDIKMREENGFDLVKILRDNRIKTKVVIFSGSPQYAYEAIKLSVFDFIKKPWDLEVLEKTLLKFEIDELQVDIEEQRRILLQQVYKKMAFKTELYDYVIKPENIIYCSKKNNTQTILYIKGQKEGIEVNSSLKDIENKLSSSIFFKIKQTHLINLKYVYKVSGITYECVLRNDNFEHNLVGERRKIGALRKLLYEVY